MTFEPFYVKLFHACADVSGLGERERANLVVRFLFIYNIIFMFPPSLHLADPAYKLRYFICDTRGPTRNHGKNTT